MSILNIAGYKFVALADLPALKKVLLTLGVEHALLGTVLLSAEGINLMLAGEPLQVNAFLETLLEDERFQGMTFRQSISQDRPFKQLKVKIRAEIITLRTPTADPLTRRTPAVTPQQFRQWMDEGKPMMIVDTRNAVEVEAGAFEGAVSLGINEFGQFPDAIKDLRRDLPVVMYCTGGVRCEKAGIAMQDAGFPEVYQLQDGILGYFAAVGGAHYQGNCFVFDQRVALDADLKPV